MMIAYTLRSFLLTGTILTYVISKASLLRKHDARLGNHCEREPWQL